MNDFLDITKAGETFTTDVQVRFAQKSGAYYQGTFSAEFRRIPQEPTEGEEGIVTVQEMLDDDWTKSDVLHEVLVGVSRIGNGNQELPPDEAKAWALRSPECVSAMVDAFFLAMAPDRSKTTSKRRSKRGSRR